MTAFGAIGSTNNIVGLLCRETGICLLGAIQVSGIEPVTNRIFVVDLNATMPTGQVSADSRVAVLPVATGQASTQALIATEDTVRSGMRLPEGEATREEIARFARSIADVPGPDLIAMLEWFPQIGLQPDLSAALADAVAAERDPQTCAALSEAAWRHAALSALDRPGDPLDLAKLRLRSRVLDCAPASFPEGW